MDRLVMKEGRAEASTGVSCVRLLGHPGAEQAGQPLRGLERNPKKLAVLAYLALLPAQKFVARDALLAVFWSESPEKPARHALSQTLHFIRQHLGSDALLTSGTNLLKLNPSIVEIDVRQFEAALDSGDVDHACALYRGDLLDGISLETDAADWLDRERQRLRLRAAHAFWQQAVARVRSSDSEAAARCAQRAIESDPTAESECVAFLSAAIAEKQYGLARAVASFFATTLERATGGDSPSDAFLAHLRELQQLPAQPEVVLLPAPTPQTAPPAAVTLPAPTKRYARIVSNALITAAALFVLAFAVRIVAIRPGEGSATQPAVHQLVITETTATEKELELLLASVVDVMAADFGKIGWKVIVRPADASDERSGGYILELRTLRGNAGVLFTYRMREAVSNAILASNAISFPWKPDVGEVARSITFRMRAEIGRKQPAFGRMSRGERANLQRVSLQSVLADSLFESGSLQEAARAYEVADSMFAAAKWSSRTRLIATVRRLQQLESLALARFSLEDFTQKDSVFVRAEKLANDLVKNYKGRPEPLEARASLRFIRMFLTGAPTLKGLAEVEADLRSVVERNEASSAAYTRLSAVLEHKGDLRSAGVMANEAARRDDFLINDEDILFRQFRVRFNLEDDAAAARSCKDLEGRYPNSTASSVCRLTLMGWSKTSAADTAEAARIVREGAADESEEMRRWTIPRLQALQAGVFARAGFTVRARAILKSLEQSGDPEIVLFRAAGLARAGDILAARELAASFAQRNELAEIAVRRGRLYRGLLDPPANADRASASQ